MTFIVPGDRRFVIIPKHSNLPLAPLHHRKEKGTVIQQQEPYKNNPAQQFQLQKNGAGEYHVYLPYSDLWWAVAGVSQEVGASLTQWLMQDRGKEKSPNQRFRFMYAGDGYYYLRPAHANGLVLEVPNAGHGQDTIKQGNFLGLAAHQMFRIVPVSPDYMANQTRTFQQYSDLLRDGLLGLTGLIPTVGGGAKAMLGVIWPDGHDQDFWNQTTQYVEQRMKQVMEEKKLADLRKILNATRSKTKEFLETDEPEDKLIKLIAAISKSTDDEQQYLEDQEGAKVMSMLMAWGTLVMTLRAEMVQGYDSMHPDKSAEGRQRGKAKELSFLKEAIGRYRDGVERARARALEWRLSFIRQESKTWDKVEPAGATISTEKWHTHWVTDHYDGWRMERESRRSSSRPQILITHARQAREAQVRAQFGAELDVLLAPSYLWSYLDPTKTEAPTAHKIPVAVGTFGGQPGGTPFGVGAGGLQQIALYSQGANHPFVCGLRLTYADGVEHIYGVQGNRTVTLTMAAGEYITNVRGYESDLIEGLVLETNHARMIEAGRLGHNSFFEAGLDDTVNARLVGISGSHESDHLKALTFHWEYTLKK